MMPVSKETIMRRIRKEQLNKIKNILGNNGIRPGDIAGTNFQRIWRVRPARNQPWIYVDIVNGNTGDFREVVALWQNRTVRGFTPPTIAKPDDTLDILKESVGKVKDAVESLGNEADLKELLKREKKWKNRKGVIEAIKGRIKDLG
jgi:hypothetical protein